VARRVGWTTEALADLKAAADYIARDSPRYAAALARQARVAAVSLADLGERGRIVPEVGHPAIRELFVRNYRLIYRTTEDEVIIIAFIHGARDLWALWQRESRTPPNDADG
jgi:plasmid stabilization system protein ParE